MIIELAEDEQHASAHSYYTVIQATKSLPLQPIISGRYADRFRKTDDGWEFSEREMFVDLLGDLSAHLLYELDATQ